MGYGSGMSRFRAENKRILTEEYDEFLTWFGRDCRSSLTTSIFASEFVRI